MTTLDDYLTEADFQEKVLALARLRGWLIHHDRRAPDPRQGGKWRTVIEGDKGFPDLVLAREGTIIFAELKSEKGRMLPHQHAWINHLLGTRGMVEVEETPALIVEVWRPSDMDRIKEVLW